MNMTQNSIVDSLSKFADPRMECLGYSFIDELKLFLAKERAIYMNLNLMSENN